ncbi:helix-turn-helix domain-containing protein [Paenibacillus paridis]|uniref:helix-turn-helix domain-containing protein n=1 Tax=Paenibacillus paridis TaxID=2583376 RepID=UPI0013913862|nr:helix-turn-helix domain-containing protein [Paenibacillus paridis]
MNKLNQSCREILHVNDIQSIEFAANGEIHYASSGSYTLIICLHGEGLLGWGQDALSLVEGEISIQPPGRELKLRAMGGAPLKGLRILYDSYLHAQQDYGMPVKSASTRHEGVTIRHIKHLIERCDCLYHTFSMEQPNGYSIQSEFYGLMALMEDSRRNRHTGETTAEAILRVSNFMRERIDQDFTRAELAQKAGLSQGYFSRAFQEEIGKTPTKFIMDLRMAKAKNMLLYGNSVKDTAVQVGFEDEFYFSRKFKQHAGLSPLTYMKSRRRNIASVSEPISGSMLALQLLPKAAAFYPTHTKYAQMLRLHANEAGIGQSWHKNVEMLQMAAPELIFCTDFLSQEAQQDLKQVAPVIRVPWLATDWREQLLLVAEATGYTMEGEQWLGEYERKAERISRKIRQLWGSLTINICRITDQEYRIYGDRNAGAVLYRDLRLSATHELKKVDVYATVNEQDLPAYDADALIVMVDPSPKAAMAWRTLQGSRAWQNMSAVKNQNIYEIGTEKLFEYSAWSHDRSLSFFAELLGKR